MDAHTVAFEGDVAALRRLAELGPIHPSQQDVSGHTLLYAACRGERCSPAVVSFLLHECVSPDQSGSARIASTGGSLPQHGAVMAWKDLLAKGPVSADAERIRAILLLLKGSGAEFRALNESGGTALQEFKQLSPHALSATIEQALATSAAPSGRYLASFLLHRSLSHLLVVMYPEEAETHSKARLLSYVNWPGKAALPAAEWFAYTSPFRFSMPSASVFRPHPLTLALPPREKAELRASLSRTDGGACVVATHHFHFRTSELREVLGVQTMTVGPIRLDGIPEEIAGSLSVDCSPFLLSGLTGTEHVQIEVEISRLPQLGKTFLIAPLQSIYPSRGFWPLPPHTLLFRTVYAGCCGTVPLPKVIERLEQLLGAPVGDDDMGLEWTGHASVQLRLELGASDTKASPGAANWARRWPRDARSLDVGSSSSGLQKKRCSARDLYRWFAKTLSIEAHKLGHEAELDYCRIEACLACVSSLSSLCLPF